MATAANNDDLDCERFAALWAGADTDNSNEAEAIGKFRATRRMAAACNLRIVDCMTGRDDVMKALDNQMKPLRKNSGANPAELVAARERADKLGEENLQLMRKVRELAETLKQEQQASATRQRQRQSEAPEDEAPPRASADEELSKGGCAFGAFYLLAVMGAFGWLAVAAFQALLKTLHHWLH